MALDGTAASSAELVRALRDAARQEGSVLACAVVGRRADDVERAVAEAALDDQVARAVAETGVRGRTETALLDAVVFEACAVPRTAARSSSCTTSTARCCARRRRGPPSVRSPGTVDPAGEPITPVRTDPRRPSAAP